MAESANSNTHQNALSIADLVGIRFKVVMVDAVYSTLHCAKIRFDSEDVLTVSAHLLTFPELSVLMVNLFSNWSHTSNTRDLLNPYPWKVMPSNKIKAWLLGVSTTTLCLVESAINEMVSFLVIVLDIDPVILI